MKSKWEEQGSMICCIDVMQNINQHTPWLMKQINRLNQLAKLKPANPVLYESEYESLVFNFSCRNPEKTLPSQAL